MSAKKAARFMQSLGFPPDAAAGVSSVTLSGGCEVYVSECLGILRYGDEEILLRVADGKLLVRGRDLTFDSFGNGAVKIKGKLCGVELI